ncbi:MAG: ComEC/Rec2 family competence protein [Candidatus Aquicultorales bacterium]
MSAFRLPPVFFFACCLAIGVALFDALQPTVGRALVWSALLLVVVPAVARAGGLARVAAGAALFVCIGVLAASSLNHRLESGPLHGAAKEGKKARVTGIVAKEPVEGAFGRSFELKSEQALVDGTAYRTAETVRVRLPGGEAAPALGSRVAVEGRTSVPGASDPKLERYLFHKGISAQLSVTKKPVEVLDERGDALLALAGSVRERFKRCSAAVLDRRTAGLLNGIVLGDTRGIGRDDEDSFRASGLSHLVAVSGMNIMFLIGALWPLLKLARASPLVQVAALSAAVWFYALATEGVPSILRAAVMGQLLLLAWLWGRDRGVVAAVSAAAVALLAVYPFYLFDIGFQLSFGATLAMVWLAPPLAGKFAAMPRVLGQAAATAISAQLGVAPIIAAHFGEVSVVSPVANIFVVPAAAPAMILGLAGGALDLVSKPLSIACYRSAGLFVDHILAAGGFFASFPVSSVVLPAPGAGWIIAYYTTLAAGCTLLRRLRGSLSVFHLAVAMLLPAVAATSWIAVSSTSPRGLEVSFLDVGQGDAILVRDAAGGTVLVDAGPDPRLVAKALSVRGVRKVDVAVLTHGHADHVSGFEEVIRAASVGRLLVPPKLPSTGRAGRLVREALNKGVGGRAGGRGCSLQDREDDSGRCLDRLGRRRRK